MGKCYIQLLCTTFRLMGKRLDWILKLICTISTVPQGLDYPYYQNYDIQIYPLRRTQK